MSLPNLRASLDKLIDQYGWEQVCDTWNEIVRDAKPKPHLSLSSTSRPATPSSSQGAPRRTPSYLRMTHVLGNPPTSALPSLPDPMDNRISSHSNASLDVSKLTPPMSEKRFDFGKSDEEKNEELMASLEFLKPAKAAHKPADYSHYMDRPVPKRPPRPESGILLPGDFLPGLPPAPKRDNRSSDGSTASGGGKLQLPYEFADDDVAPPVSHRSPSQHGGHGLPGLPSLPNLPNLPALPALPSCGLPALPPTPHDRTHRTHGAHGAHDSRRRHTKSPKPSPRPSPSGSPPKLPPPSPIDPLPAVPSRSSSRAHHKAPGPAPGTNIAHTPTTLPYTFADDEPEEPVPTTRVRANVQQWEWEETADSN